MTSYWQVIAAADQSRTLRGTATRRLSNCGYRTLEVPLERPGDSLSRRIPRSSGAGADSNREMRDGA